LWSGLTSGAFYGLIGLAYLLFLRATGVINFAIGAYVVFVGLSFEFLAGDHGVPIAGAIVACIAVALLLGLVTEIGVVQPMQRRLSGEFGPVMALIALLFIVEQLAGLWFGRRPVRGPQLVNGSVSVFGYPIAYHDILALLIAGAVFALIAVWLRRGRYGRMLRAVGDNLDAARALGIPVFRVRLIAVALTALIACSAGVLVSAQTPLTFQSGVIYALLGFVALILGGTSTSWAPLVGGLLLGLFEAYVARIVGAVYHDYAVLALVLVLFAFRPEGIFAVRVRI
jgi:branched-chain amino acid transport system permease protein